MHYRESTAGGLSEPIYWEPEYQYLPYNMDHIICTQTTRYISFRNA